MQTTTGLFTIHQVKIPLDALGLPVYLMPFGDIHRNAPNCHKDKWLEFLDWAKHKGRCYFLGMGDYDDLASTSERMILSNKGLHDSTKKTLDDLYLTNTELLYNEIQFMQDNMIGLMEGNHYGEFINGTTTTQKLAELLKCKYLGVSTFIRLSFEYSGKRTSLDVWAHHGKGNSRYLGGSLKRVEDMSALAEADIYLMGHDHKKSVGYMDRLVLKNGHGGITLHHRKQLMARTGSFLKGYEPDSVSYVADAAMNPTNLGVVKIELTPKVKAGNFFVDIHASI